MGSHLCKLSLVLSLLLLFLFADLKQVFLRGCTARTCELVGVLKVQILPEVKMESVTAAATFSSFFLRQHTLGWLAVGTSTH